MSLQQNAPRYILASIVIASFFLRIAIAFSSPGFSDDASYFALRQAEIISTTGKPLYDDMLSYGGKEQVIHPIFYYFLAGTNLLLDNEVGAKIFTNLLFSLVAVIVYLIAYQLTKHVKGSLVAASASVFLPIIIEQTVTTINTTTLAIPLLLLCIYFFITSSKDSDSSIIRYIIALVLLCFTSGISFILIIGLALYYGMMMIENIPLKLVRKELILFTIFFGIWTQFIIYKKAFLAHGVGVIWQNIPVELIQNYFVDVNILTIIYALGIIPFLLGIYALYMYIVQRKDDEAHVLISVIIAVMLLLLLRLLELRTGLIITACVLVILCASAYRRLSQYLSRTKIALYRKYISVTIVLLFLITSIIPALFSVTQAQKDNKEHIEVMKWIESNTPQNSTILGTLDEGNMIATLGKRKNVLDNQFLLATDTTQRLLDTEKIYTTSISVQALSLLEMYNVQYILVGNAKKQYHISELKYTQDTTCFDKVYDQGITIYEIKCTVEKK